MHHRPVPRVEGYVWWCGDEWCDCTQAQIERVVPNPNWPGTVLRTVIWSGTFYSGGEAGATTELNRVAGLMRRRCHDLYAQIWWPWNKDRQTNPPAPLPVS
jgi:hypothetical protein